MLIFPLAAAVAPTQRWGMSEVCYSCCPVFPVPWDLWMSVCYSGTGLMPILFPCTPTPLWSGQQSRYQSQQSFKSALAARKSWHRGVWSSEPASDPALGQLEVLHCELSVSCKLSACFHHELSNPFSEANCAWRLPVLEFPSSLLWNVKRRNRKSREKEKHMVKLKY